jgi:outer membrane protein OmpA-like peptidoglycan-associated protein
MTPILIAAIAASMPVGDATSSGAAGVFGLPTPSVTPDGKARIGFGMDYWRGGDFLLPDSTSQSTGAALSVSAGFAGFVEGFGAIAFRSTNLFSDVSRRTLVSFGDADLGVKVLIPGNGPFSAGLLAQLDVPSGVGGFSMKGVGGRGSLLFGYAHQWLAVSALLGYRVDNSGALVTGTPGTLPAFAYALSSYDTAQGAVTLQIPLRYGTPAAAFTLESPVARQTGLPIGERPLRARLVFGMAQLHTEKVPGLSLSAALQLSLRRDGRISERALPAAGYSPDPPWTVLAGLAWTFERPGLPRPIRELAWHDQPTAPAAKPVAVAKPAKTKAALRVTVLDAKTQLPIAGAWVSFVEGTDVGGTTGPEGNVRVETDAGTPTLAVARDGYELLTELVTVSGGEERHVTVSMQPAGADATVRGRIVGEDGLPLRASVSLFVPGSMTGGSAPEVFEGAFSLAVQHGSYQLDASAPGYRATASKVELRPGETITRDIQLRRIAGEPRARLSAAGIEIGAPIAFARRAETLDPSAQGPLLDVAQALKSERRTLEVVGRTAPGELDDEAAAQRLSEARARAVIELLRARGVRGELLVPRGLGVARPGQPLLELRVQQQKEPRS